MFNIFIASFLSTIILFSFGSFFQKLFLKEDNNNLKLFETGFFGCIFLGFIGLIVNFFLPLNKFVGDIILIFSIIYFIFIFQKNKSQISILVIVVTLFSIILVYASNINRPDAGLYHIPFISILHENKIILGLTNLHHRFGHISIMQYISGIYHSHFFKIEFFVLPLASIFGFFFYYLIQYFLKNYNTYDLKKIFTFIISIFSFYSFNRYSNYGNDAPAHMFFFLIFIYFININNFKQISMIDFFKISIFSIFCLLNKNFMILTLIIPIVFLVAIMKKISFKNILLDKKIIFCIVFIISWALKNILISGCIVYPLSNSCFNSLKYTNTEETKLVAIEGESWAKDIVNYKNSELNNEEYINNFNWIDTWRKNHFLIITEKFSPLIIFLIIYLILTIGFNKIKLIKKRKKKINKTNVLICIITSTFVLIWFVKFPLYRFGMSFLAISLISFFCIIIDVFNNKQTNRFINNMNVFFLSFAVLGFLGKNIHRINNFDINYNNYPWPKIYTLSDKEINFPKEPSAIINDNNNLLYYFSQNECMYTKSPCSNYFKQDIKLNMRYGYKIFY